MTVAHRMSDDFVMVSAPATPDKIIKLSFKDGGRDDFNVELQTARARKSWVVDAVVRLRWPFWSYLAVHGNDLALIVEIEWSVLRNRRQSGLGRSSPHKLRASAASCHVLMKRGRVKLQSRDKPSPT